MRECGLKLRIQAQDHGRILVTPLAGVWIEIIVSFLPDGYVTVSLPLRECGLKYITKGQVSACPSVTPLAGVWIEIFDQKKRMERL